MSPALGEPYCGCLLSYVFSDMDDVKYHEFDLIYLSILSHASVPSKY